MKHWRHNDVWIERVCHLFAIIVSVMTSFLLRFEFSVPPGVTPIVKQVLLIAVIAKLPVFDFVGVYRGLRKFVSLPDLYLVLMGNVVGSLLFAVTTMFFIGATMPRSIIIIDAILCFVITSVVRFSARICNHAFARDRSCKDRAGVLIYGAGATGAELVREIRSNQFTRYEIRGFLDDDPMKEHALIMGVPVLGTGRQLQTVVRRLNQREPTVQEVLIAMPHATGPQMREALASCRAARIPYKAVPALGDLLTGKVLVTRVRNLPVQDLLGRPSVRLDHGPAQAGIAGQSVLVTGAAGYIGSELCRQIAQLRPACLVAFDQAESELFRIENELRAAFPRLGLVPALGDIRDANRLSEVIQSHAVEHIFHAAAYKHVPMMESNVLEAVRNNILGTWNLARAAKNVRSLLMISSDKAVNPICVMGATKRVCEQIVSALGLERPDIKCTSVRFGNVLGSNGSVVPIFRAQIEAGGPIKVTHPHVRRYFMTVSEAASLVLQAASRSRGSEIFVLDMGEPIRIVDLAENMVRLSGMVPYEEIDIQFTGLRPGEKLVEELNGGSECAQDKCHEKMWIIRERPLAFDKIRMWVAKLEALLAARSESEIVAHLQLLVPEYSPGSSFARRTTLGDHPNSLSDSSQAPAWLRPPALNSLQNS